MSASRNNERVEDVDAGYASANELNDEQSIASAAVAEDDKEKNSQQSVGAIICKDIAKLSQRFAQAVDKFQNKDIYTFATQFDLAAWQGTLQEFIYDKETLALIDKWNDIATFKSLKTRYKDSSIKDGVVYMQVIVDDIKRPMGVTFLYKDNDNEKKFNVDLNAVKKQCDEIKANPLAYLQNEKLKSSLEALIEKLGKYNPAESVTLINAFNIEWKDKAAVSISLGEGEKQYIDIAYKNEAADVKMKLPLENAKPGLAYETSPYNVVGFFSRNPAASIALGVGIGAAAVAAAVFKPSN